MNIKVFNQTSIANETRTFKCEYRFDPSVCNNRKRWNNGKCRCRYEYKELIYKERCNKGFMEF